MAVLDNHMQLNDHMQQQIGIAAPVLCRCGYCYSADLVLLTMVAWQMPFAYESLAWRRQTMVVANNSPPVPREWKD
jgi:hypothetical protein